MPLQSAGILLYRHRDHRLEALLVHPGGPFWKNKDAGAWSIPKGLLDESEPALEAARREFSEETGSEARGPFLPLGEVRQAGGKIVHAWAAEGDLDVTALKSNTYAVEFPKGTWRRYPEVDRGGWFALDEARQKILKAQAAFIDRLEQALQAAGA